MTMERIMQVPLSAPNRRFQSEELITEIQSFLKKGPYLNGGHVQGFESEFASYVGTKFCIGVCSGTGAIELALLALDLPKDTKVLAPANAGAYTSIAASRVGLSCTYYDVNDDGLPTPELLEVARNQDTRVAVITHLYGQAANMKEIVKWAEHAGIVIIEDCAQAAGARLLNGKVGSFGILSTFSFYPTKNLGAIGDAGAVCTNDSSLVETMARRRQYGWSEKYDSIELGSNLRMDEIQALVLRMELPKLDKYNLKRKQIWDSYYEIFKKFGFEKSLIGKADDSFVAHLGVLKSSKREEIRSFLTNNLISADVHYPIPDYKQPTFRRKPHFELNSTERLCNTVLSIPLFEHMTDVECENVQNAIEEICKLGFLAE